VAISAAVYAAVAMIAAPPVSATARDLVRWRTVPSPSPGTYDTVLSVSALSSTNAWAVGSGRSGHSDRTLVEHWDGSNWRRVVQSPNPDTFSDLYGVFGAGGRL
jgi:hypothetical protein